MKKALLVEDNVMFATMLFSRLEAIQGLQVCGVETIAREAIEAISIIQPDIVTLDIRLKEGSGINVLKSIKRIPNPPRVIMLSNKEPDSFSERCIRLGAEHYFDKSMQFEDFIGTIKQMVGVDQQIAISGEVPQQAEFK